MRANISVTLQMEQKSMHDSPSSPYSSQTNGNALQHRTTIAKHEEQQHHQQQNRSKPQSSSFRKRQQLLPSYHNIANDRFLSNKAMRVVFCLACTSLILWAITIGWIVHEKLSKIERGTALVEKLKRDPNIFPVIATNNPEPEHETEPEPEPESKKVIEKPNTLSHIGDKRITKHQHFPHPPLPLEGKKDFPQNQLPPEAIHHHHPLHHVPNHHIPPRKPDDDDFRKMPVDDRRRRSFDAHNMLLNGDDDSRRHAFNAHEALLNRDKFLERKEHYHHHFDYNNHSPLKQYQIPHDLIQTNLGTEYTNPDILRHNCSVTFLLMDPNLGKAEKDDSLWYTLESVATNIHPSVQSTTCFLIQTSHCQFGHNVEVVYSNMAKNARPAFKQMIDNGNVRVTILDSRKYNLRGCSNFYNPSKAWMNYYYWGSDEFIEEDSDLVISIQSDVIFCHTFHPNNWREFAFVGGLWPPEANMNNNPEPPDGLCKFARSKWRAWNKPDVSPISDDFCTRTNGIAPVGNGGLTVRSRKWLRKAIAYCPDPKHSGFEQHSDVIINAKCMLSLNAKPAEDVYFATILRGLGAPLPTAFEAALFSVEMVLPEQAIEYYSTQTNGAGGEEELEDMVVKRWGQDQLELFRRMRKEGRTIPIGFHKPYWYHNMPDLVNDQMSRECKWLYGILPANKIAAFRKEYPFFKTDFPI